MNYIETDKVILNNNEQLNPTLVCIICAGIVIEAKQCSICNRLSCSKCLINQTLPIQCQCESTQFTDLPDILLNQLRSLNIRSSCCNNLIPYDQYLNHYTSCSNLIKCSQCNFYYKRGEDHIICLKLSKGEKDMLTQDYINRTISQAFPDSGRDVFVHTGLYLPGKCYICGDKAKYNCYKCKGELCKQCGSVMVILKYKTIRNNISLAYDDYRKNLKCSVFFPIIHLYSSIKSPDYGITVAMILFITMYAFLGWLIDVLIFIGVVLVYIILMPMLFLILLCIFMTIYVLVVMPMLYFYWLFYLNKKRKCERC
jgi:hypothetical protein